MSRLPRRQGDLVFIPVDSIPEGLVPVERDSKGRLVLAHGEDGHVHAILDREAELFRTADMSEMADRFLRVEREVLLVHEDDVTSGPGDHDPFTLSGDYIVRRKREYTPERIRYIAD